MRRRKEYNRILRILDILSAEGIDILDISYNRDFYTLSASQYSLKVTELLQKDKCNFRIDHKSDEHHWIISMK